MADKMQEVLSKNKTSMSSFLAKLDKEKKVKILGNERPVYLINLLRID